MLFLFFIATLSVALTAAEEVKADAQLKVEVKEELKPEESVHEISHSFSDGLELIRHRDGMAHSDQGRFWDREKQDRHQDRQHMRNMNDHDLPGPVILRTPGPLPNQGHPDIEAQNRIIADVFSPDYYQPTWVLDYRYLKTGGRDYTRGPGGQVLILPKGVRSKEHKEFPDYDSYIEHLRLSRLSERQHNRHRDQPHRDHDYYGHNRGHGQTMWHKYT